MPEYAGWPRRLVALLIDWVVCTLVTIAFIGPSAYAGSGDQGFVTLLVYLLEATLGTALVGASFGQLLVRIRVLHLDGRPMSFLGAFVRSLLICLVVPPLIYKSESGRGLHDLATDSAAYRLARGTGSAPTK